MDFTIADFVADLRAPTPSAAAEMVVAAQAEFRSESIGCLIGSATTSTLDLQRRRATVHALERRRGLAGWPARLAMRGRHAAELGHGLRLAIGAASAGASAQYTVFARRLEAQDVRRRLAAVRGRLQALDAQLYNRVAATSGSQRARGRHRWPAGSSR